LQTLSFNNNNTQKIAKTQRKIPINLTNKPSFFNQEAFTNAIENMVNYCEDHMLKEIPRNTCFL